MARHATILIVVAAPDPGRRRGPALNSRQPAGVIVCGDLHLDRVPRGDVLLATPRGGAFNTAVATAKLGMRTTVLSFAATDHAGGTPIAVSGTDPAPVAQAGSAVVHVASLAAVPSSVRHAILEWRLTHHPRAAVTFDINARRDPLARPADVRHRIEPFLAVATLVRTSSEDLASLYPGRSIDDVVADWFGRCPGIRIVAVTRGDAGSRAYQADRPAPAQTPPVPVRVADSAGADDAFTAALIDGLFQLRLDLPRALRRASMAAAITSSRLGVRPPTRRELDAALRGPTSIRAPVAGRPRMAEVAAAAGVSVTTVSHVINETRVVSPDTAHRVRTAIAEVGYCHPLSRSPILARDGERDHLESLFDVSRRS